MSLPRLHIVTPAYNAQLWIGGCIRSVLAQEYWDWVMHVVDDRSVDDTHAVALDAAVSDPRILVSGRAMRVGALANIIDTLHSAGHGPDKLIDDDSVVVLLDGDDELPDTGVLGRVAELFADPECMVAYGSYVGVASPIRLPERGYTVEEERDRSYRAVPWRAVHLQSFRYGLWRRIRAEDLLDPKTGKPWDVAWDMAFMFPMLEMCRPGQVRFMREVMYRYNDVNPLNDFRIHAQEVKRVERLIRAMPRYPMLEVVQ